MEETFVLKHRLQNRPEKVSPPLSSLNMYYGARPVSMPTGPFINAGGLVCHTAAAGRRNTVILNNEVSLSFSLVLYTLVLDPSRARDINPSRRRAATAKLAARSRSNTCSSPPRRRLIDDRSVETRRRETPSATVPSSPCPFFAQRAL